MFLSLALLLTWGVLGEVSKAVSLGWLGANRAGAGAWSWECRETQVQAGGGGSRIQDSHG